MEQKKPLKIKFKTAVILIITAVVLLGIGANVYATKQGYDNIFFLIKYKISGEPKETITGKENLLTDIEKTQEEILNKSNETISKTEEEIKKQENNNTNSVNKEIYKRVRTKDIIEAELKNYNEQYIVIEGNKIYFSNDLSNKVLEGTYKVDSKNNINYNANEETEDYAFYNAATFRFENINGIKNIVVDNSPNGIMYFENVQQNTDNSSKENINYSEITKKLQNNDLLTVTETIKNNNGTYTLKGKIITIDTSRKQDTEFPYYKETGEYKQITLAANTKFVYDEEEKTETVEKVFSNKSNYGISCNFNFENGKCVSVNEVVTGH